MSPINMFEVEGTVYGFKLLKNQKENKLREVFNNFKLVFLSKKIFTPSIEISNVTLSFWLFRMAITEFVRLTIETLRSRS